LPLICGLSEKHLAHAVTTIGLACNLNQLVYSDKAGLARANVDELEQIWRHNAR